MTAPRPEQPESLEDWIGTLPESCKGCRKAQFYLAIGCAFVDSIGDEQIAGIVDDVWMNCRSGDPDSAQSLEMDVVQDEHGRPFMLFGDVDNPNCQWRQD